MREAKWHIAYTYPRSEKKVFSRTQQMGVESFLPLHTEKRYWSDRIKFIEVPLFSSYIFIKTPEFYIPRLMEINGISRFISFNRKFATIDDAEIQLIKDLLKETKDVKVLDKEEFRKGKRVRVVRGPFQGLEGTTVSEQGKNRLIITIEGMDQELSVNIPMSHLELMNVPN